MAAALEYGVSSKGNRTLIHNNFEYWRYRDNKAGETAWRCTKNERFRCKGSIKTKNEKIVENSVREHNHSGNVSLALARKAVASMKDRMTETISTPSSSQAAVIATLGGNVQMALPKKATLSRVLRRHRQFKLQIAGVNTLPAPPTGMDFVIPSHFQSFLLHDSCIDSERLLIFGDRQLLEAMSRAEVWLADGTFKVVPSLWYQLYTVHFQFVRRCNPVGIYSLLPNKTRKTYDRLIQAIVDLLPTATPTVILLDFETAAMQAFTAGFQTADITGCYFHLCQSVIRKVNEIGLKTDYETDDTIRGCVRCLPALSHVPAADVLAAFELLIETFPPHERLTELVAYFELTYIRGRRRPGRGENYAPAVFPIQLWNQYDTAGQGIARTTNSVEGWHYGIQSLFMCQHPTLWIFLDGLMKDCQKQRTTYLQSVAGVQQEEKKQYRNLMERVKRVVQSYRQSDVLTYLFAIAHLSHS